MAGTLVANTINTDTGLFSTNNAYLGIAKAWVNFNGNGSTSINNSFNVSSVTYNSTGDYTINFTTAMTNANYVPVGIGSNATGDGTCMVQSTTAPTTTAWRTTCKVYGSSLVNATYVYVAILGS